MGSIICGNCRNRHSTVAEVRACHAEEREHAWTQPKTKTAPEPAPARDEPEGYFTVTRQGEDHVTLRFRRQPEDDKFMPGKVLVGYLTGPENLSNYLNIGNLENGRLRVWRKHRDKNRVIAAIKMVLGDPDDARERFDEVVGAAPCLRCGRLLTVPASVHNGYGPVCIEKV